MSGEKTAVAAVLAAQEPAPVTEQLELLGAPITAKVSELRAERKGPGRPPGSLNKRTSEWAAYLTSRYTSPAEVLAQMATARVDELAASLGCSKLEAWQEKRLAAIALAPYLHTKMPLAVDLTNHKVISLTIGEDAANDPTAGDDADDSFTLTLTPTVIKAE